MKGSEHFEKLKIFLHWKIARIQTRKSNDKIFSATKDATITSSVEDSIEPFDVQSLLDEIAALKKSVKEANEEVTELKSALNSSLNNPAIKADMDAKSPVDEVLCSKSTCDTTLITCSVRHYDEFQYDHGENGMRTGAD